MRQAFAIVTLSLISLGAGCSTCQFYARIAVPPAEEVRRISVTELAGDRNGSDLQSAKSFVIEDRERIAKIEEILRRNNVLKTPCLGVIPITRYRVVLERDRGEAMNCDVGGNWIRVGSEKSSDYLRMSLSDALALRLLLQPPPANRVRPAGP
jgi:hypothetical protein